MARKKSCAQRKISKVMKEWKSGKLKSNGVTKVRNQRQAVAIALSEARKSKGHGR